MQSIRIAALVASGALLVGCYTLQPTGGVAPEAGTRIALDINDAGRVALGGSMGPEIARVEGRLLSKENGEYHIAVTALHLLRGGEQTWSGEDVRIKSEYVSSVLQRKLSPGRSLALGAVGVGSVAFFVTRSILGGGDVDRPVPPSDSAATHRIPQP